jgi:hypothetical protein
MKHGSNYMTGAHETVLKTVVRKDLWVRVPRPPLPVTCGFALHPPLQLGGIDR